MTVRRMFVLQRDGESVYLVALRCSDEASYFSFGVFLCLAQRAAGTAARVGRRRRPGDLAENLRCLGFPEVGASDSYAWINLHVNG